MRFHPRKQATVQDKSAPPAAKEHAFLTFQLMCNQLGPPFEPYMLQLVSVVLGSLGDSQAAVREAAEGAAHALATHIATQGVHLVMPALLDAMGDRCALPRLHMHMRALMLSAAAACFFGRRTWKKKETSLHLLAILAKRAPRHVGRCLPAAIPKLMECLQDTHPKVSAAAAAALADVASAIPQPEIQKNMAFLIDALSKPEQKTAACLEKVPWQQMRRISARYCFRARGLTMPSLCAADGDDVCQLHGQRRAVSGRSRRHPRPARAQRRAEENGCNDGGQHFRAGQRAT